MQSLRKSTMRMNTLLLHGAKTTAEYAGSQTTLPPICQSSAFAQESGQRMEQLFAHKVPGYSYTRLGNPTVDAFEQRMTLLEGGRASIACASGMAAIFNALLNILQRGDEVVSGASLYGGTIDLFRELESFGITTHFVPDGDLDGFARATTPRTRCYFAETIGNPKLDVTDIAALAELAHQQGLPLIVDNTVATACLVRPLSLGADVVINSTSKYINGSSNSISGVITDGGRFLWDREKYPGLAPYARYGPLAFSAKLRSGFFRNTGACLSPQNAFYNILGMETLGIRIERIGENALALAEYLDDRFPWLQVNYPGLAHSPWHEVAKRQFIGGYGGILTLRAGSKQAAYGIMDRLTLALQVSNIGDTKTLVIHPASTLALYSTREEREAAGVYEDLIRISVGIEDIEDLKEDFAAAICRAHEEESKEGGIWQKSTMQH